MKNLYLLLLVLCACQTKKAAEFTREKIEPFKISIETDATWEGTRSRYTLTNELFEHRYLKDQYSPSDTVLQFLDELEQDEKLREIASFDPEKLNATKSKGKYGYNFTFEKNGKLKTVPIDAMKPDEFICKVIAFINQLSVEKYQLGLGCTN